jgi:hypothetical protein
MKTKSKIETPETPKYYLADVPQHVRVRALDLCIRRYWHQALELLQEHGFNDYTLDDLFAFYGWAPEDHEQEGGETGDPNSPPPSWKNPSQRHKCGFPKEFSNSSVTPSVTILEGKDHKRFERSPPRYGVHGVGHTTGMCGFH